MREASIEVSPEEWQRWILEAIRKIRFQKQRPSVQRICQAIGSHHKFHEDIVAKNLEEAVEAGAVLKIYNKGMHSYKAPFASHRHLVISNTTNLSRLVAKAVRELGECDGSTIKSIENYIQKSNKIQIEDDVDYEKVIKESVKKALNTKLLVKEGKLYKVGELPTTPKRQCGSNSKKKISTPKEAITLKVSFQYPHFHVIRFLFSYVAS